MNQGLSYYFFLDYRRIRIRNRSRIRTDGSGSGFIPRINGSRRSKNIRILRIRIHNTAYKYTLIDSLMKKQFDQPKFNPNVHTHGCQPAEGCQSENKINISGWPSDISRDTVTRVEQEKNLFSLKS